MSFTLALDESAVIFCPSPPPVPPSKEAPSPTAVQVVVKAARKDYKNEVAAFAASHGEISKAIQALLMAHLSSAAVPEQVVIEGRVGERTYALRGLPFLPSTTSTIHVAGIDGDCTLSGHAASQRFKLVLDVVVQLFGVGVPFILGFPVFGDLNVFRGLLIV
ncbi:hypothetical protein EST38_g9741 [Candolleomyces aberdarensis]|uniref:Uncharacterized protein n=1 Tax=Candolleomyces aberdarensis TaxID=2316362 RepID=A0A4Q2D9V2_9AGAR|nr:hypothetical protein EST38_g9741 [Candolleomyces aberdarensis]